MTELLTAAQMRAIEQAAIDSGEVTGLELMERAGRGVVEAMFEEWPELAKTSHRAVVLCGPGNNGGDGFVVARLLKEWGWEVEVFLYGDHEKLPPDAKVNCARWLEMGAVRTFDQAPDSIENFPDLVIDAIFGTGLKRPLPENVSKIFCTFSQQIVASIDILSGQDSNSGRLLLEDDQFSLPSPSLTVTFHRPKIAHFLNQNGQTQKLRVVDIGLPTIALETISAIVSQGVRKHAIDNVVRLAQPSNTMKESGHKYYHGHALVLSGPPGHGGAARLAARGALRIGAGVVTIGSPTTAIPEHAAQLDAIMVRPVDRATGLAGVLEDTRISSICMGPGLGLNENTKEMVNIALKSGRKCVLDADALSVFQNNEGDLFALCHDDVVLTPHGGEFARLFPDIAEKLATPATKGPAYSKVDATRDAAKRAGCVVLFKGADTVIAHPDGRCSINSAHYERAAPWLATAGSGDVLAGFITGLLARGFAPMMAAETGAWLHVECARSFGPGLIAEDLPEELPKVFRALHVT